jgi:hypothetical protein
MASTVYQHKPIVGNPMIDRQYSLTFGLTLHSFLLQDMWVGSVNDFLIISFQNLNLIGGAGGGTRTLSSGGLRLAVLEALRQWILSPPLVVVLGPSLT